MTATGETANVTTVTEAMSFAPEPSVEVAETVQTSAALSVKNPVVTVPVAQSVDHVTLEPLLVDAENCWCPPAGIAAVLGEMMTVVPLGIDTESGRFWLPPAVSEIFRFPENVPTVEERNWMVTVQLPPPETAPVQVLAEIVKAAAPASVTVGVTAPVPILDAVKTLVTGVEIVVCCVHEVGEIESGIKVCSPATVTVAVAVVPPLIAVAVIV